MATTTLNFQTSDYQFREDDYQICWNASVLNDSVNLDWFLNEHLDPAGSQDEGIEEVSSSIIPNPASQHPSPLTMRPDEAIEHAVNESGAGLVEVPTASSEAETALTPPQSQSSRTSTRAVSVTFAYVDASSTDRTANSNAEQQERAVSIGIPSPVDKSAPTSPTLTLPSLTSRPAKQTQKDVIEPTNKEPNELTLCKMPAPTSFRCGLTVPKADGSSSDGLTDSPIEPPEKGTKSRKRKHSTASPVTKQRPRRVNKQRIFDGYQATENYYIGEVRGKFKALMANNGIKLSKAIAERQRSMEVFDTEIARLEAEKVWLDTSMNEIAEWEKKDQNASARLG